MDPLPKGLLTIKEFSKLTHTPIDTLKYYDRIDILKPAWVGNNRYRYYKPEQAVQLTRIIFGVRSHVLLNDIKKRLLEDNPDQVIDDYNQMYTKLENNIQELKAMQNSIRNLTYYYSLYKKNPLETLFTIFLPEWVIIYSPKVSIYSSTENEINIANNLFIKGFCDNRWPHYLLGAYYDKKDIQKADFTSPAYYLKVDYPEQYDLSETQYIPSGNYVCFLTQIKNGYDLPKAIKRFLDQINLSSYKIEGYLFVMDVVNSLITSSPNKYCTMLYSRIQEKH